MLLGIEEWQQQISLLKDQEQKDTRQSSIMIINVITIYLNSQSKNTANLAEGLVILDLMKTLERTSDAREGEIKIYAGNK